MKQADLLAELRQARMALDHQRRAKLLSIGIPEKIITLYPLIGVDAVKVNKDLYEPSPDGGKAYITPVLVADAKSPETPEQLAYARHLGECVDLIAWHPERPEKWALRTGAAEWLGCIEPQYLNPHPVHIHRTVLSWLQNGCDGLMPLCRNLRDLRRVLIHCTKIKAQDKEHAAELRRALRLPWIVPAVSVGSDDGRRTNSI